MQGSQQRLERPRQQRLLRFIGLVLLKGEQAFGLVDALGFITEQHGVTVKGNTHLMRIGVAGVDRLRINLRGGHTGLQRGAHVAQMGAEKQVGVQGFQVAPRRLAARETAADDGQAVVRGRLHHAQAANRIVARQDHDLHRLVVAGIQRVKSQHFLHQGKRHARLGGQVQALQLQRHVGAVIPLLEEFVFFLKVKQGTAGDRHHQLAVERDTHDCKNIRYTGLAVSSTYG